MICYRENSKADNRSRNEDQEVHAMILSQLMGEDTEYLND